MSNISFEMQKSTELSIYEHLLYVDNDFRPKLSDIIDIKSFSKKISDYTIRFEAWHCGKLIGLASVYYNDNVSKIGFINHVCIFKEYRGSGYSDILLNNLIKYGKDIGFKYLKLKVSKNNDVAIKLYKKYNFIIEKIQNNKIQMCKTL